MRIKYFTAHEKCQFYAFRDVAKGADRAEYFMAPKPPPENHFDSNQIRFYSKLGKVFPLAEFQAKLSLTRNWVGGFYRDSLLIISETTKYAGETTSITSNDDLYSKEVPNVEVSGFFKDYDFRLV